MDRLRWPLLLLSLISVGLALLLSLGSSLLDDPGGTGRTSALTAAQSDPVLAAALADRGLDSDDVRDQLAQISAEDPPGLALPGLALILGLLLLVLVLTALPLLIGDRRTGTVQGVISIVGGLIGIIVGVGMAIAAFASLLLMVSLLLSVPFGTLTYIAVYGSFDTAASSLLTTVIMVLLAVGAVCLLLAQQRFLASKGLVLLYATALGLTLLISLLHALVPRLLVSITDAVGALIVGVVGAVWALVILIGGVVAAVRLLRLGRQAG